MSAEAARRHAERCPGCALIAQPYADGLAGKAQVLLRALARYAELGELAPESIRGAEQVTDYRLRAKLVADGAGRLGLFEAGTHDVVDICECPVLEPRLREVAGAIRSLLPLEIPLAGVDLRVCDRGVLVSLIVEGRPDAAALAHSRERVLAAVPQLAGLALNVRPKGSVQLLGPELVVLHGADAEPHHLSPGQPWHFASHGAFTQAHGEQASRLHAELEGQLSRRLGGFRDRRVLELYAGSGALALRLAARGASVTAVEAFEPAVRRITAAAAAQSLPVEARAADAEVFLARALAHGERWDAIIVNPPRRGVAPGVRSALARLSPTAIAYISCNPETLARDLEHLALLRWKARSVVPFDMIPLSSAVEALVILEQSSPPAPRVLFEDARSLALYKLPFEPTTPQGESEHSLLVRAREALGLPELTPVHRLDQGTSGVCWFARRPSDVAELARALERGEKTYTALALGVCHKKGKIERALVEAGKAKRAVTRYRRRAVIGGHSLLELWPEQGRKHQLRRHLASIGHPILGDERHGRPSGNLHFEHRHGLDRPFLHCAALELELESGKVRIEAELAGDLAAVLDSLRGERD